ncbi:Pycsar system effector family protein [Stenotrophomonas sp.]|uniref:Pycsar system effector family protein n=1 Tax=Stenotrophomonas sp. TaxID=69392 RepID=UPI0028B1D8C2|nr:Pycsar system effector family protein [Stenotrophomonas sp.]
MDRQDFPYAINGYLNQYIQLMDVKATAVAGAALVLIGLGLSDQAHKADPILRIAAVAFAGVAALCALLVVLPRTPHSGSGHVFWADIAKFRSANAYQESLQKLDPEQVMYEYSKQNFFVSAVLLKKGRSVRRSILWFAAACASFVLAVAVGP